MHDDVFRPGELCGTYRIVRLLGRGGFADVYQAIDVTNQQKVALKCLQLRHLSNARITQRMVAETELLSGLDHPNVVQVEDAGINGGVLWLAMEYLSGRTLRDRLRTARGPLPPLIALYYGRQIAEGVGAAHKLKVVHRDLKPENVMITGKDEVKVLDLGAAKFFDKGLTSTENGGALGTPLYMAPEQIKGEAVDGRADVYALGMILYEMLAGRHAFAAPNGDLPPAFEIGALQLHAQPKPLTDVVRGLPGYVWQVVEKATAKSPDERFASMGQLAWAIRVAWQHLLEHSEVEDLWEGAPAPLEPEGEAVEHETGSIKKVEPAPVPAPALAPAPAPAPAPVRMHVVREEALPEAPAPTSKPAEKAAAGSSPQAEPTPAAPVSPVAQVEDAPRPKQSGGRSWLDAAAGDTDPDAEPQSGVRNIVATVPGGGKAEDATKGKAKGKTGTVHVLSTGDRARAVPGDQPAASIAAPLVADLKEERALEAAAGSPLPPPEPQPEPQPPPQPVALALPLPPPQPVALALPSPEPPAPSSLEAVALVLPDQAADPPPAALLPLPHPPFPPPPPLALIIEHLPLSQPSPPPKRARRSALLRRVAMIEAALVAGFVLWASARPIASQATSLLRGNLPDPTRLAALSADAKGSPDDVEARGADVASSPPPAADAIAAQTSDARSPAASSRKDAARQGTAGRRQKTAPEDARPAITAERVAMTEPAGDRAKGAAQAPQGVTADIAVRAPARAGGVPLCSEKMLFVPNDHTKCAGEKGDLAPAVGGHGRL